MQNSNVSNYTAFDYGRVGNAILANVDSGVKKISIAFGKACIAVDRIRSDNSALGKLLLLGSYSVELLNVKALKPAAAAFGIVATVFDVFAVGGTVKYVAKNVNRVWKNKPFLRAKNDPSNLVTELSFGVTNLGEAALWAHGKNLMNLGANTAKMIGSMTVAALIGYSVMIVVTANKLYAPAPTLTLAEADANRKSNVLSLVWTVSEVALIAIPLAGFAPATSVLLAGRIVAKSAAIASFLYKN